MLVNFTNRYDVEKYGRDLAVAAFSDYVDVIQPSERTLRRLMKGNARASCGALYGLSLLHTPKELAK